MKRQTLEEYCQRYAMTEALHLAKARVKDQIKREGGKVWHFAAKEITLRAEELIEANREAAIAEAVERLIQRYAKDRGMTVDDIAEAIGSAVGVRR